MASATSLPRLPTSPAGPTHEGQPSRQAQAAMSARALREQRGVQVVERLREADAARVVVVDEDAAARSRGPAPAAPRRGASRRSPRSSAPRPGRCRPAPRRGRGGRTSGTAPPSGPACRRGPPRRRAAPPGRRAARPSPRAGTRQPVRRGVHLVLGHLQLARAHVFVGVELDLLEADHLRGDVHLAVAAARPGAAAPPRSGRGSAPWCSVMASV